MQIRKQNFLVSYQNWVIAQNNYLTLWKKLKSINFNRNFTHQVFEPQKTQSSRQQNHQFISSFLSKCTLPWRTWFSQKQALQYPLSLKTEIYTFKNTENHNRFNIKWMAWCIQMPNSCPNSFFRLILLRKTSH